MSIARDQLTLFGIDLSVAIDFFRVGLSQLMEDRSSLLVRHFEPAMMVYDAESDTVFSVAADGACSGSAPVSELLLSQHRGCIALLLPSEEVLTKSISVPTSAEAFLAETVSLEVSMSSPFGDDLTCSGYCIGRRGDEAFDLSLAMTSAPMIEKLKDVWNTKYGSKVGAAPEIWSRGGADGGFVVLDRGSNQRRTDFDRALVSMLRKGAVWCLLLFAALWLPAAVTAFRAESLSDVRQQMQGQAAEAGAKREALQRHRARSLVLAKALRERTDHSFVLNDIAREAPDTVFLQQLEVEGRSVTVSGFADNASAYLGALTQITKYTGVAANSAFVRDPRSGLERFSISWTLASDGESK